MARVINQAELADGPYSYVFNGREHGDTSVSFIHVALPPGKGPRLHTHAYDEVFVILEGTATFRVGKETVEVRAGDVVIGPANVPHGFTNTGTDILRQVDIHLTDTIQTTWLEDV